MTKVLVPIAEGFEEIEAVSVIDVLRRGGIEVVIGSVNESLMVKGAHGIMIRADREIAGLSADELDMIVLPGGWGNTKILATDLAVQSLLKQMDSKGKGIGAICAAPYALAKAGVLKEGYTCYPSIEEKIDVSGFRGEEAAVVETDNIITSRGPGTAIYFALAIVKKLVGDKVHNDLRTDLLV